MNVHDVLLDIQNDNLIFVLERYNHSKVSNQYFVSTHSLLNFRITFTSKTSSKLQKINFKQIHDMLQLKVTIDRKIAIERVTKVKTFRLESNANFLLKISIANFNFDKIIKRSFSNRTKTQFLNVIMIEIATFYRLNTTRHKIKNVKCYFMIMKQIDFCLQIYRIDKKVEKSSRRNQ